MKKFLYALLGLLTLAGCAGGGQSRQHSGPLQVSVSVAPLAWFVDRLAGDLAQTHIMVPKGVNPEEYDPSPREIATLEESELFVCVGTMPFEETWVRKITDAKSDSIKILDLSTLMPEAVLFPLGKGDDGHHGHGDPHIWSSFAGAKAIAEAVYDELVRLLPEDKKTLQTNYEALTDVISNLRDTTFEAFSSKAKYHAFLIYHPSLTAYSMEMGLRQIAVEGSGKEPSVRDLTEIIDLVDRVGGVGVALVQKEFNAETVRTLADRVGAEVVEINPYDYDWEAQMRLLRDTLAEEE